MNINSPTNLPYTQNESALKTRPVDIANLNTRSREHDQTSLSEQARMLQQREQHNKAAIVNSLNDGQQKDQEETPTDESIRVSSTTGRQMTAGNFTKTEAVDLYRSIQNLL